MEINKAQPFWALLLPKCGSRDGAGESSQGAGGEERKISPSRSLDIGEASSGSPRGEKGAQHRQG